MNEPLEHRKPGQFSEREAILRHLGRQFYLQLDAYTKLLDSRPLVADEPDNAEDKASPAIRDLQLLPGDLFEYENSHGGRCEICRREGRPDIIQFNYYDWEDGGVVEQDGDTVDTFVLNEQGDFMAAERRTATEDLVPFTYEPIVIDEGFIHKMATDFRPAPRLDT